MRNASVFALSACALVLLAAGGWLAVTLPASHAAETRRLLRGDDVWCMKQVVGLARLLPKLPMRDGAFDPYQLVWRGEVRPEHFHVFRSVRFDGPTDEEILAGDYTNLPWERYRGPPRPLDGPPFPLLWDQEPDEDGIILVGLSNGRVVEWDAGTLEAALAEVGLER